MDCGKNPRPTLGDGDSNGRNRSQPSAERLIAADESSAPSSSSPHVLSRTAMHCLMREVDPAATLSDDAAELMLSRCDAFYAAVIADASSRAANGIVTVEGVRESIKRLFNVDV
jgi:hypothetical protein